MRNDPWDIVTLKINVPEHLTTAMSLLADQLRLATPWRHKEGTLTGHVPEADIAYSISVIEQRLADLHRIARETFEEDG